MTEKIEMETNRNVPTVTESLVFRFKTALLQLKRIVHDLWSGGVERHKKGHLLAGTRIVGESTTGLWSEGDPAEKYLVAGKVQNLRLAASKLDGLEVPTGAVFSFWKQVGRTSRFKGFVAGRELREGCIIPNIGGGLCQISNALYDSAVKAGFEIIERHSHTRVIPGSLAETDRDATVFWNYVDLRFRSPQPFRIEAFLDRDDLTVRFRGENKVSEVQNGKFRRALHSPTPNSCVTCEMGDCHRVVATADRSSFGHTAYLLDEFSPEFDAHMLQTRGEQDELFIPLDGKRFRKPNYAWTTNGFAKVGQSLYVTANRSLRSRRLSNQGAERQKGLLQMYEELAASFARRLRFDTLHVVVQQNLLPFLFQSGALGGRTFDVLMTAFPMAEIQARLDAAHKLHPESRTLGDFRAEQRLVESELEALGSARKIVTPHTAIAKLFPDRSLLIDWAMPVKRALTRISNKKPVIVFPAATVGRKGCYELREAIDGLNVKLLTLGPMIESADFWNGFEMERGGDDWLHYADIVVLPAFVEHKPRRLIMAAAAGIPVIASTACGVDRIDGICKIEAGDAEALRSQIVKILECRNQELPLNFRHSE